MAAQLLAFSLGLTGLLGAVTATLLPQWRQTAYTGSDLITATSFMKGLWMDCVWHSTGVYQCEIHRSLLALPRALQAARALMALSCMLSILALLLASLGMKCTRCAQGRGTNKSTYARLGGLGFLFAGLCCLVTVSWSTHDAVRDFYRPVFSTGVKYDIGWCVYIGFASGSLSVLGGAMLCTTAGQSNVWRQRPAANAVSRPSSRQTTSDTDASPSSPSDCSSAYRLSHYV